MITLVTLPPAFGLRNVSPFCLKVEMTLKWLELPHEIELQSDPRKAPKGKLPVLRVDGRSVADSELILAFLEQEYVASRGRVYAGLSASERGLGTAATRLAEDHLYWLVVASRWLDDAWWPNVRTGFFGAFPPVLRSVVPLLARREVARTVHLQGLGRHTLEEQKAFARADLEAITGLVGEGPYLLREKLSVYDFAVASLLSGMLDNQPATWMHAIAEDVAGLRDYAERVQKAVGVWGASNRRLRRLPWTQRHTLRADPSRAG